MNLHEYIRPCLGSILTVIAITACSVMASAERTTYWKQRASLFELLPVTQNDIIFLGNSITDGGEFAELFPGYSIKNRGISGDVISGVEERIGAITSGHPAKIFLLIGINDISHNLTPDDMAVQYEGLVKKILKESPSTTLYLQSIMPIDNSFQRFTSLNGHENDILEMNKRIKDIANRYNLTYIDLFTPLSDPSTGKLRKDVTNDGLHILGEGYRIWADAVKEYVIGSIPSANSL